MGYSSRGCKESDTTERLYFTSVYVLFFFFKGRVCQGSGCCAWEQCEVRAIPYCSTKLSTLMTFESGNSLIIPSNGHRRASKRTWYSESEVAQSCPTLCDPMDCSLSGSSVHGIFLARVLERIAISFSRGSSRPRNRTWISRIGGRCFTVGAQGWPKSSQVFL